MNRVLTVSLVGGLLLLLPLASLSGRLQEPGQQSVKTFMRAKLEHSQKVLEGLTVENYDLIAKHSNQLLLLSNEAAWHVLQTPEFNQHSSDFRRSVDRLTAAAKKKNLDGATLAFLEVTMRCVECHKYVRQVRIANNETPIPTFGE